MIKKEKLLNVFRRCCLSSNLYDRGLFLTTAYTKKKRDKRKMNELLVFILFVDECMQSEKCPQLVLCTVIRYCSYTVCGSNNL